MKPMSFQAPVCHCVLFASYLPDEGEPDGVAEAVKKVAWVRRSAEAWKYVSCA